MVSRSTAGGVGGLRKGAGGDGSGGRLTGRSYWLGLLFIIVAVLAAGMLVLEHLGGIRLPGCAQDSPCARSVASAWGTIPVIQWPTSFLGFTFFLAVLVAWLWCRDGLSLLFRSFVRLGALASLLFLLLIVIKGYFCQYCLVAHAGNLAFWWVVERAPRRAGIAWPRMALLVGTFVLASGLLAVIEYSTREAMGARQERERIDSRDRVLAGATENPASAGQPWAGGFTGRYRLGPEQAAVRIVAITDYQCKDCGRLEKDLMAAVEQHESVSLSIKHFPMCSDCNVHFPRRMHPNACWAARAAEAAGILKGPEGFFAMHRWLFDQQGGFTNEQLHAALRQQGLDAARFIELMRSEETLARVQADIEEAVWLGLHYTPMIFINGVEFKGIFAPDALPRTVAEILAESPAPRTAEVDAPPPATRKIIDDWLAQPRRTFEPDPHDYTRGAVDAKVRVILWGDYQEPFTAEADSLIRAFMAGREDGAYSFRHFPVNEECNPVTRLTKHEQACLASRAAEAAGQIGGREAYWRMHEWLFAQRETFSPRTLLEGVRSVGLDPLAFQAALDSREVTEAITEDCVATRPLALRSIPCLIVNERFVPRWRLGEQSMMHLILEEAATH